MRGITLIEVMIAIAIGAIILAIFVPLLQSDDPLYDCEFENMAPPTGYIVNESQILDDDSVYVIVHYNGRTKAFQRRNMGDCEQVVNDAE